MYQIHNKQYLKKYRQSLRQNQTKSERELWKWLRGSALGYKFRRQHSIQNYIVDFYCTKLRLIIEVDGYIHGEEHKKMHDIQRQHELEALGYTFLRVRNEQILFDSDATRMQILNECDRLSRLHPL